MKQPLKFGCFRFQQILPWMSHIELDLGIGQQKNSQTYLGYLGSKLVFFHTPKDRKDHPMEGWTNLYDAGLFSCLGPQNNASFEGPMILRVNWKSVKFVIHYFLSCYLLSLGRSFFNKWLSSGIPTAQWNSASVNVNSCICREGDRRSPNHFPAQYEGLVHPITLLTCAACRTCCKEFSGWWWFREFF